MKKILLLLAIATLLVLGPSEAVKSAPTYDYNDVWAYKVQLNSGWKYGYLLKKTGEWVILPQFDYAYQFNENGLASIYQNGRFGVIDLSGSVIQKPQFRLILPFKGGMAKVQTDNGDGFINEKGLMTIPPPFANNCDLFSDGLASIRVGEKTGFVDKNGQVVIEPQYYEHVLAFNDGLAAVRLNGKWGYIDRTGQIVIKPIYSELPVFHSGFAKAQIDNKWGFLDQTGRMAIKPLYESVLDFREGFAAVKLNGKWGFIDVRGNVVIEPQYDSVGSFSNSIALVRINGKQGCIDKKGHFIIPLPNENQTNSLMVYSVFRGMIIVTHNGKLGVLESSGNMILPVIYDEIVPFFINEEGEFLSVRQGNKIGLLGLNGRWIYKPSEVFRRDASIFMKQNIVFNKGYFYDTSGNKLNHYINHMNDGYRHLENKQYAEASLCFQKALLINPDDAGALFALSQIESYNGTK